MHIKRETIRGPEPIEFFDIHKPKEVIEYLAKLKIQRTKKEREIRAAFREEKI